MYKLLLPPFFLIMSLFQLTDPTPTPTTPPTSFPLSPTPVITPTITPVPTLDPAKYPAEVDPSIFPTLVIQQLRDNGLDLPRNGRVLFSLDNAFAKTSDPGFNLITIG